MLGADLIGFHIQAHCNNFLETVDRTLESRIDREHFAVNRREHITAVKPFPISVQAISKHLKVLERAGLITRGRDAQLRPSRLHGAPLREAADWLEQYRPFWEESFDRLDQRLRAKGRTHG